LINPIDLTELNNENDEFSTKEDDFDRAYTAPARPLTDIEEFRRSSEFLILEKAVLTSQSLILKGSEKYDLDVQDG